MILLFFRTDTVTRDCNVIRREFLLPTNIHRNTDEGSSSNENPVSPENASPEPFNA